MNMFRNIYVMTEVEQKSYLGGTHYVEVPTGKGHIGLKTEKETLCGKDWPALKNSLPKGEGKVRTRARAIDNVPICRECVKGYKEMVGWA